MLELNVVWSRDRHKSDTFLLKQQSEEGEKGIWIKWETVNNETETIP